MAGEASAGARERAGAFLRRLDGLGYGFFAGVPCSLLNGLYAALAEADRAYQPATREDLALGLAAGAALAGRRAAVLMQNSGLGLAVNALLSLQRMYELPVLLIVTWRGCGPDAPEHVDMGRRMPALLEALGIPSREALADDACDPEFHRHAGPVALIVRPGDFA